MQGLRIISKTGDIPSAEEIDIAHRVANRFAGHNICVINHVDIPTGIVVEYHRTKRIAFVQGGNSIYFGFNATVDMRCWCRGVIFDEAGFGTDNYRSAAFLTDGTELASMPIVKSVIQNPPYEIYTESNRFVYKDWFGGTEQPLYDRHVRFGDSKYTLSGLMSYEVPDDACIPAFIFTGGNYHLGDEAQTVYSIRLDNSVPSLSDVSYGGYFSKQYSGVINQDIQMSVLVGIVDNQIKPALQREYKRRKKCSDGQMAYLRSGFMSPEIERFVKAWHPVSALVRRDIPMQIVSEPVHTLINEERDVDGALIASAYECRVVLKYESIGDDGIITANEKEFVGQVRFTEYTATYTNYPLLGGDLNGGATPVYTEFMAAYNLTHSLIGHWVRLRTGWQIAPDKGSDISSLFCELNGTLTNNESWNPTDEFYGNVINYAPGETLQSSYGDLNISHPQFILDYIAVSKPIEKELDAGGNKVLVTPSTDWLSSRLSHDEVVTVVPLSFINADGVDRGMYPHPEAILSWETIARIKLVGFAKFKFNYYTSSFTFVSWTEFTTEGNIKHDGNATYDDETNPTSVTVGETTYTLQPKYFAYDEEYGSTNCVCIGNKAIWTDVKADAKEQKANIADTAPEGYELTDEERLFHEVRQAIK